MKKIHPSQDSEGIYKVKSRNYPDTEYVVDMKNGMCTCCLGWNGQPTGEPCRHQSTMAKKENYVV